MNEELIKKVAAELATSNLNREIKFERVKASNPQMSDAEFSEAQRLANEWAKGNYADWTDVSHDVE